PPPPLHSFPTRRSSDLFEEELVVTHAETHAAVFVAFEPQNLLQRFPWNEDREIGAFLGLSVPTLRKVDQRHAMTVGGDHLHLGRSEEHTSELQSLAYLV